MDGIEILIQEHEHILQGLTALKYDLLIFMNEGASTEQISRFREYIQFIRFYADQHHHQKEENYLFQMMETDLGEVAQKLVQYGMLQEHSTGRYLVQQMELYLNQYEATQADESKLDFIGSAMAYVHHLQAHIQRENQVVFTFAKRELSPTRLEELAQQTAVFETQAKDIREHYLSWLSRISQ